MAKLTIDAEALFNMGREAGFICAEFVRGFKVGVRDYKKAKRAAAEEAAEEGQFSEESKE